MRLLLLGIFLPIMLQAQSVRVIYFTPKDVQPEVSDWESRIRLSMELVGEWYARINQAHGYGPRTLNFEKNPEGQIQVKRIIGRQNRVNYKTNNDLYNIVLSELQQTYSLSNSLLVVFFPQPAPWLGSRPEIGGMGLVSTFFNASVSGRENQMEMFCDDMASPPNEYTGISQGQLASLRLGGLAHEIGHAMGAPHSPSPTDLMSAGFWGFSQHFTPGCITNKKTTLEHEWAKNFSQNPFMSSQFKFSTSPGSPIISAATGLCVDVPATSHDQDKPMMQWSCHGGDNQQFRIVKNGNHGYQIKSIGKSNRCFEVLEESEIHGLVVETSCGNSEFQHFDFISQSDGTFALQSKGGKKLCLDSPLGQNISGTSLEAYKCHFQQNQKFRRTL